MYATGGKVNEQRAYLLRAFQGFDVGLDRLQGGLQQILLRLWPEQHQRQRHGPLRILSSDELLGQRSMVIVSRSSSFLPSVKTMTWLGTPLR